MTQVHCTAVSRNSTIHQSPWESLSSSLYILYVLILNALHVLHILHTVYYIILNTLQTYTKQYVLHIICVDKFASFRIVDESLPGNQDIQCTLFHSNIDCLPNITSVGTIIRLHRVNVSYCTAVHGYQIRATTLLYLLLVENL